MDILIKNMEMPYSCEYCPIYDYDEKLCRQEPLGVDKRYTRDNGCPLVEVPPHGRLIDADDLEIKDEWALVGTDAIWNAPTVLEASNE